MGTFLWIIGIGFVVFIIYAACNSKKWSEESQKYFTEKYAKQGKKYVAHYYGSTHKIKYISGFKDKGVCDIYSITLTDKDIEIEFEDKVKKTYEERFVLKENIKDIYISSEYELKEKISAGKIMVFGLMGLGMTRKEEEIKEYIVIECKYENYNTALVLKQNGLNGIVKDMRELYL
ncbi:MULTISPECIES: hypothetical protein [unclassified Clostridium]|uniref:hypothetical protein n=1 Tax=unclassified Clostridium TaxID=2614128 RepID=UPI0025BC22DE|nr:MULTISPECIES: hypothetical protein [unclassified Clostridium]